jgi:hypothetical protein
MADKDADLMRLIRERYDAGVAADRDNRQRDQEDRLFYTGGDEQWPKGTPKERFDEGRPCQSFNRLPQFVKQVSGEIRQNKPAIKVLPVDGQTDPEVANVYSAIIRHIEGACGGHRIYANETEKAVIGGQGWWRIKSAYCNDADFDQDLGIEGIPNPLSVVCDPDAQDATRCDMKWAFVSQLVSEKKFKKEYPDCSPNDFQSDSGNSWVQGEFVRIAEYWEKREVGKQTVFAVVLPQGNVENRSEDEIRAMASDAGLGDEIDAKTVLEALGLEIKAARKVPRYEVRSRLVTGSEPLGPWQKWPGKYIPLVRVVGEEVAAGDTIFRHGLIHHAKPAQIGYNYARNAMMERHATSAKAPWLIALKQIPAAFKNMWENANKKNYPFLPYEPIANAPPPQRIAPPALDAAAYQESLIASEDMKASTGIYDAALGAKSNETSGVAIARRDAQGDTATYVYIDNMEAAIATTGRILIDLIPHYYDDSRVIRMLGEDEEIEKFVQINQIMPDGKTWNDVTRGKYDVVVSTGPAYASKRAEAADRLTDLVAKFPALQQLGGDLVLKALDVPYADKLADRLAMTLPPGMDEEADKKRQEMQGPPQPSPEEMAMQAEQQAAQAKLQLQAQESEAKLQIQQREAAAKIMLAEQESHAKMALAEREFELEARLALARAGLDAKIADHNAALNAAKFEHDAGLKQSAAVAAQELAKNKAGQQAQAK